MPSRRTIALALLAGFAGASLAASPAAAQADFRTCLSGLRPQAADKGVSPATFEGATRDLQPGLAILELMDNQPEFKPPI